MFQSLAEAPQIAGALLQLDFNRRSSTFAGNYALTARLKLVVQLLEALYFFKSFVGKIGYREGLTLAGLLSRGVVVWAAWQSWTLPRVEQVGSADEED